MTQHKPPQAVTLFDLLARTWAVGTEVRRLMFNASGSTLAASLADGRLAVVSVKDAESPDSRVRVEADTGRASIRPRSKPLPPPVLSEAGLLHPDVAPCRLGAQGLAFAHAEGAQLWRATARGQTLAMNAAPRDPVTALAALPRAGLLAVGFDDRLALLSEAGGAEQMSCTLPHELSCIAVSADETQLACWGAGQLSLVSVADLAPRRTLDCPAVPAELCWSPCGRWLLGGCPDKALLLVDTEAGACDRITGFPAAVQSVGISPQAQAVMASGAFRAVGWALPELPFGGHAGTPIETGRPGLTLVDRIAVHPTRDLCALGYATGLVMLCRIGHGDEMLVREGSGAAITALGWSDDGAHLAIGDNDGSLSIATFPQNMFK